MAAASDGTHNYARAPVALRPHKQLDSSASDAGQSDARTPERPPVPVWLGALVRSVQARGRDRGLCGLWSSVPPHEPPQDTLRELAAAVERMRRQAPTGARGRQTSRPPKEVPRCKATPPLDGLRT